MTETDEFSLRLHGYADRELDDAGMAAVEAHLQTCAHCRDALDGIRALKAALRTLALADAAPGTAAGRIRFAVAAARRRRMAAIGAGAGGLLAACLAVALWLPGSPVDDAVKSHSRAVAGETAIAVVSSQRAFVKPWLQARLGFAPPVLEKADRCTLSGARTDVLARHRASAVTYSCDGQSVDFYAIADRHSDAPPVLPHTVRTGEFHVVTWKRGRLTCYAVSDVPEARLLSLARYIQSHAAEG
ncbi:MAG: anti-sigma factor family protein [Asticcacaulis sp.]